MTALLPRIFPEMSEWFDIGFPFRGSLIRIEDVLTDNEYVLRAELPGMNPEKDITVTVNDGVLRIRAERSEDEQTKQRSEFHYGMMERLIRLPAGAEENKIDARYDKGVLVVHVPISASAATGRTVPIKV